MYKVESAAHTALCTFNMHTYLVSFLITLKFAGSSGATTVQFVLATLHW